MRVLTVAALAMAIVGCNRPGVAQDDAQKDVLEYLPKVEQAVGLPFKHPPAVAVRTRAQVRTYLEAKLAHDLPPDELQKTTIAYRLFGLLPDTLNLHDLLLSLYTEQVAGYYDPDSATLYVVAGSDPAIRRITLAHELVHALQGQYVALDSLLDPHVGDNDERTAAQAVMEGQATLASLTILVPGRQLGEGNGFWDTYRRAVRRQHAQMPVFNSAPLLVRESLIFPYLDGAMFVQWFDRTYPDTVPFGPRLPRSTEQILHPDRYRAGDEPIELPAPTGPDLVYSDNLGEFEVRILLTQLSGSESIGRAGALRWGGDRYAVLRAGNGRYALVWWVAWDDVRAAQRFAELLERYWPDRAPARRSVVERIPISGHPGVRLMDAPEDWAGWDRPPRLH